MIANNKVKIPPSLQAQISVGTASSFSLSNSVSLFFQMSEALMGVIASGHIGENSFSEPLLIDARDLFDKMNDGLGNKSSNLLLNQNTRTVVIQLMEKSVGPRDPEQLMKGLSAFLSKAREPRRLTEQEKLMAANLLLFCHCAERAASTESEFRRVNNLRGCEHTII